MAADVYVVAGAMAALAFFALHWFPWGDLPGRGGRPLHRLVTYSLGMGTVLVIVSASALRYAFEVWDVLLLLWLVSGVAGLTTFASWFVRWALGRNHQAQAGELVQREARRLHDGE